jgi:predicted lysophospholipase L1 biosynthesis ABC-type transport system permease subunit
MAHRMIFLRERRRASIRRMSLFALLMAITAMIFLAGVRVGVQYASYIDERVPVFASLEL